MPQALRPPGTERSDDVQAVGLTIRLLEALGASPGRVGITQLTAAIGTTKTRVFRHLKTLERLGWVMQDPVTDRYQLGLRALVFGGIDQEGEVVRSVVLGRISALAEELKRTVFVATPHTGAMEVVAIAAPSGPELKVTAPVGQKLALHASAPGKVALAFGPPELLGFLRSQDLPALTPRTIVSMEKLDKEVARVRREGAARAFGEATPGISAIAVPILIDGRDFIGALTVVVVGESVPAAEEKRIVAALKDGAESLDASVSRRRPSVS